MKKPGETPCVRRTQPQPRGVRTPSAGPGGTSGTARAKENGMIAEFQGEARFLSNFYAPHAGFIKLDGMLFDTVEHAYQAAKTLDIREREIVQQAQTPGQAKRAGRHLTIRPDWNEVKVDIMLDLLRQKFSPWKEPSMAELLDKTGDQLLMEGNTWGDTFWGVCRGEGQNMLGQLLMQVRDENRSR